MDALPALTQEQRDTALNLIRQARTDDTALGNVAALRQAGVEGTKGQIRNLIDDDLAEELREARGWSLVRVEDTTFKVAMDPDHPNWDRANSRVLRAYHPAYRDISRHELTGKDGGPVQLIAGRFDPDQLTLEELETLKELAAKATPKEITDGAR
jgi:hypothetical protein